MNNNKSLFLGLSSTDKENPVCLKVIPSSWTEPQLYHVILEDGEFTKSDYLGEMTKEQIHESFDVYIDYIEDPIYKIILENPNDQDLGKKIRSLYNSLKNNNEKND